MATRASQAGAQGSQGEQQGTNAGRSGSGRAGASAPDQAAARPKSLTIGAVCKALAQEFPDRVVAAIDEYAGVSSPIEHARQVIWAHRRQGDLRYLKRIRYSGPGTLRARLFGLFIELRWRYKLRNKLLRSATYRLKARKMLTDRRPGISS